MENQNTLIQTPEVTNSYRLQTVIKHAHIQQEMTRDNSMI